MLGWLLRQKLTGNKVEHFKGDLWSFAEHKGTLNSPHKEPRLQAIQEFFVCLFNLCETDREHRSIENFSLCPCPRF